MTTTTMRSFANSTGKSANSQKGQFNGTLLGKLADGLEALEAIKALAVGHANRFMELAIQAAHVTKQKLDAAMTIPFASKEIIFNAAINPARVSTPKAPSLGGARTINKSKRIVDE